MATTNTSVAISYSSPDAPPGYSQDPGDGFVKALVKFVDGSAWKITGVLSRRVYSKGSPPAEARQVFTCVCVSDPAGKYTDIKEAVIKVKYQ